MSATYDDDADDTKAKAKGKKAAEAEADLIADAKDLYRVAEETWQQNRRDFLEDIKFARLEEQWPEKIKRDRELDGRPCLTLNQLHAFIFQVVNDARQNRPSIDVHPVSGGADPKTAEFFNGLIRHIQQSSDADVAFDTAVDAAVSGGFGFFRINTAYGCDDNFEKDLVFEQIADAAAVYPDPHSTKADSSDWNDCFIIDEMSKKAWEKRWPEKDCISFDTEVFSHRDVADEEMLTYAEHWSREEVLRTIVSLTAADTDMAAGAPDIHAQAQAVMDDQPQGDALIVGMDVYTEHRDLFDALGMTIQGQREVKSYKVTQRLLSGSEVLETVEWAGTYIPIVPVWGELLTVEGKRHLRSLVRGAKDAQRMYNYWSTCSTELVALAPKAPFIGKTGQFVTDAAKWATANTTPYSYIEYDTPVDGNDTGPPQRQPFAGVPAGAVQQTEQAQQNIMSIIGVYKSSLGAQSNEESGVAINARDAQADTGTFHFRDNLNRAIRHAGRILLDLIPKVYSTPRILRILGTDGKAQMVPVNQPVPVTDPKTGQPQMQQDPQTLELVAITHVLDLTAGKYDLVVKTGPNFASQREQLVSLLMELIRSDRELAPLVMDLIVKNFDIPDADEIVQRLQAQGPQSPALKQARDVIQKGGAQIQALQAEIAKLKADRDYKGRELEIKAFGAETDRLQAIVPEGDPAAVDPAQMAQLVMTSLFHIMQSPDIFEAAQNGAGPEDLTALLMAKMGQGASPDAPAPGLPQAA